MDPALLLKKTTRVSTIQVSKQRRRFGKIFDDVRASQTLPWGGSQYTITCIHVRGHALPAILRHTHTKSDFLCQASCSQWVCWRCLPDSCSFFLCRPTCVCHRQPCMWACTFSSSECVITNMHLHDRKVPKMIVYDSLNGRWTALA